MVNKLINNSVQKPKSPPKKNGGKRRGAGRPPGAQNKKTIEKAAITRELHQLTMQKAKRLHNRQYNLAMGVYVIYRIDVDEKTGKKSYERITNEDEITRLLNEYDGMDGINSSGYYVVEIVKGDNRAIEAMLDRTFGKAPTAVEMEQNEETRQSIARLFAVMWKAITNSDLSPAEQTIEALRGYCQLKGLDEIEMSEMVKMEIQQLGGIQ